MKYWGIPSVLTEEHGWRDNFPLECLYHKIFKNTCAVCFYVCSIFSLFPHVCFFSVYALWFNDLDFLVLIWSTTNIVLFSVFVLGSPCHMTPSSGFIVYLCLSMWPASVVVLQHVSYLHIHSYAHLLMRCAVEYSAHTTLLSVSTISILPLPCQRESHPISCNLGTLQTKKLSLWLPCNPEA